MDATNKDLRKFITKKYLTYTHERDYKSHPLEINQWDEYNQKVINLFWEKLEDFPRYNDECYQHYLKQRSKGLIHTMFGSDSSNPDIDYACRISGISSSYMLQLQREFYQK